MLCKKPFMMGLMPCGCGQCVFCRVNRARLWAHRIELESFVHSDSCFVTLTYDEKHFPRAQCLRKTREVLVDGSLKVADAQAWIKRLRARVSPEKIRFYYAGEYGTTTARPHYHAVLFGYPGCLFGRSRYRLGMKNCCPVCDLVRDTWQKGKVELGDLNPKTAQYVCKYVSKVNTVEEEAFLDGRRKEFSRMSLRPGIGAGAIEEVAKSFSGDIAGDYLSRYGDVPSSLLHGKKSRPLGRYLVSKLRESVGIQDGKKPAQAAEALARELRDVCRSSTVLPENVSKTYGQIVLDLNAQKRKNTLARLKIHAQGRAL